MPMTDPGLFLSRRDRKGHRLGCPLIQGHLLGRPMVPAQLPRWVASAIV
jgi:hypothetical protein